MISLAIPLAFILKKKLTSPEVALLLAAIVGIISQMILKYSCFWYSMLFSTMAVMGGAIILSDFKWKKYIYAILLIFPLIYLTPFNPNSYLSDPPINTYFDDKWNDTRKQAVKFLKENTEVDDLLLTQYPILAIESGRNIFHGMEMGFFGITDEMDQATAKKLNVMHYKELINIVRDQKAKAIILNPHYLNFYWSWPSCKLVNREKVELFYYLLEGNYQVVYIQPQLVILMPKKQAGS